MTTTFTCLRVETGRASLDAVSEALLVAGSSGLETRDDGTLLAAAGDEVEVIGWFPDRRAAERAVAALRASGLVDDAHLRLEEVEDPGWREAWREYFHPIRFGRRLWVAPPDEDPPAGELTEAERPIVLRLLPSVAFGVGTHESTAMMLELIDRLIVPGASVLDVGCGTGVLAMAAVALGAREAFGIDIDPEAVRAARDNAKDNGLGAACRFDGTPLAEVPGRFDLVLANLTAPVLSAEKPALVARVAPGGLLLWSGLLAADLEEIGAPAQGFTLADERRRGEWVAQAWRRARAIP